MNATKSSSGADAQEVLNTIQDIKDLALKIREKIPTEWDEKFIEV